MREFTVTGTDTVSLGAWAFNPTEVRFLSVGPMGGGCASPSIYVHGDTRACGEAALSGSGLAFGIGGLFVEGPALGIAADEFSGGGMMIDIAGAAQAVHPGGSC